jgi:hypothetical protein
MARKKGPYGTRKDRGGGCRIPQPESEGERIASGVLVRALFVAHQLPRESTKSSLERAPYIPRAAEMRDWHGAEMTSSRLREVLQRSIAGWRCGPKRDIQLLTGSAESGNQQRSSRSREPRVTPVELRPLTARPSELRSVRIDECTLFSSFDFVNIHRPAPPLDVTTKQEHPTLASTDHGYAPRSG